MVKMGWEGKKLYKADQDSNPPVSPPKGYEIIEQGYVKNGDLVLDLFCHVWVKPSKLSINDNVENYIVCRKSG